MVLRRGVIYKQGVAETVHIGKNTVTFVLSGEETNSAYSLTEFVAVPPIPGPPIRVHGTGDEAL